MLERLHCHAAALEARCGWAQSCSARKAVRVEPLPVGSSCPVQRPSLCKSSTRASPVISTVPAAVPHPARNRVIEDIHCLNGLYNIRDRSARSLLEKELRHVGPEDGELQFIVPAPAQVRTSQLKLQSALDCETTVTKLDTIRSVHPSTARMCGNISRSDSASIATYRDIVTVDTNLKVFSSEQGVSIANVPNRSYRSCATRRGTPGRSAPKITPQRGHGIDLNSGGGSICLALRPGEVFRHFSGSRRGICRSTPSCIRRRNSPGGRCQRSSDHQVG